MKLTKLAPIALFFLVLLPSSFAHAAFFDSFSSFYTVAAPNSTVKDTNFTLNQQPWLFIDFKSIPADGNDYNNFFFVKSPNSTIYPVQYVTSGDHVWVTYSANYWDSIKTVGTWTITDAAFNTVDPTHAFLGHTSFNVNAAPEPVSTVLFLMGAFIMGISILRRKFALAV